MTIFDDLRSEYKVARETSIHYYRRCELFARGLAAKLQKHIGAPDHYADMKSEQFPYIETVGVEQQGDGSYKSIEHAGYMKLVQPDENGYWLTGLKVTLDVAPNTFPKERFLFLVRFIIRENECEMYIADSKQPIKFLLDDPDGLHPAFDLIVQILKKTFARKPREQAGKQAIGFVNLGDTQNK
jgi:hypothetical protein